MKAVLGTVLVCFLACEGVLADVATTRALVPQTGPNSEQDHVGSLVQSSEGNVPQLVVGGVALVGLAALAMSSWNQGKKDGGDGNALASLLSPSSSSSKATPSDVELYGKCYERFDTDTRPGVCTGIHGDTAVTEVFANALHHETHMLAKGFAPQQARKGMLYAGLGVHTKLNNVLKHLIKRAQSQTAFECEAKGSPCAGDAVEETSIPASVGWDGECVARLVNDAAFGTQYGLQRRMRQVAFGFRNTANELFWGRDRVVGAAVVVCVGVALHGVGVQDELAKSDCACEMGREVDDAEDFDCDDGIDTTCIIDGYNPNSVKVTRKIDLERDLEGQPRHGRVTMGGKTPSKDPNGDVDSNVEPVTTPIHKPNSGLKHHGEDQGEEQEPGQTSRSATMATDKHVGGGKHKNPEQRSEQLHSSGGRNAVMDAVKRGGKGKSPDGSVGDGSDGSGDSDGSYGSDGASNERRRGGKHKL